MSSPVSIELTLGSPVSTIKGWNWPLHNNGQPLDIAAIESPVEFKLSFPNGRCWQSHARSLFLGQSSGAINHVSVTPLKDLVEFQKAVSTAEKLGDELGLSETAVFRETLMKWKARDGDGQVSARFQLFDGISIWLSIKRHPSDTGYYLVIEFSPHVE